MSAITDEVSFEIWLQIAGCIDCYEAERGDSFPHLRPYVAGLDSEYRLHGLVELLRIEIELREQVGATLSLERYFELYPELATLPQARAELMQAASGLRRHVGGVPVELALTRDRTAGTDVGFSLSESPNANEEVDNPKRPGGSPDMETIPAQFGRYRIVKPLGKGGMGHVFLAHDPKLDRSVALKIPDFQGRESEPVLDRFLREARAAAQLRHPNICPVYDVGEIDGWHYLSMAYIPGRTLADVLASSAKPMAISQAVWIVSRLTRALAEAHAVGVVHRDIKPRNIVMDANHEPILVDFGLARREVSEDLRLTKDGMALGTPAYMSPEQVVGDVAAQGPASDIYSLGTVLYELLTGVIPFTGNSRSVYIRIATEPPVPPTRHRSDIPQELETICLRAMAKRPVDRFASACEMATALEEILHSPTQTLLGSNVPSAKQPSHGISKMAGRQWSATIAAILLVGIAAIGVDLWRKSRSALNQTEVAKTDDAESRTGFAQSGGALASVSVDVHTKFGLEINRQEREKRSGYEILTPASPEPVRIRDKVQIRTVLPRPAYPYVFWFDTAGQVHLQVPKDVKHQHKVSVAWSPENPEGITKHQTNWITINGPRGREVILAGYSDEPLTENDIAIIKSGRPFLQNEEQLKSLQLLAVHANPPKPVDDVSLRAPGAIVSSTKEPIPCFEENFDRLLRSKFHDYSALIWRLEP